MTVQVAAVGIGTFGRRTEPLVELLAEAAESALAGVGRGAVDLLVVGTMAAGALADSENLTAALADRLGLEGAVGHRVEAASATGAAAFHAGVAAIAGGSARRVLVVAGEKMTDRSTPEVTRQLARSLAPEEWAAGATMPGLAALVAQTYLDRYAQTPNVFDAVTVAARAAGARNPAAHLQRAVTADEVSASPPVALPLRRFHCAPISDGAAAAVLEPGPGAVEVVGLGEAFDALRLGERTETTTFRATRLAARQAYEASTLTRKSIDVAEVHDAFAPFALFDVEDLGFVGPGEGGRLFLGAQRPPSPAINPSGGLLARGHPVGASGLAQIVEIVRQLTGAAGDHQVGGSPHVGLAQSIGGLAAHNFVTIVARGSGM